MEYMKLYQKIFSTAALLFLVFNIEGAKLEKLSNGIYRLSNKFIEFEIQPACGGRIIRLYDKTSSCNLTSNTSLSQSPSGSGLLADRVFGIRPTRTSRNYENQFYQAKITSEGVTAELTLRSSSGPLTIEKKISLTDNDPKIKIDYALSNHTNQKFTGRFWSCNAFDISNTDSYKIHLSPGRHSNDMEKKHEPWQKNNFFEFKKQSGELANHFVYDPSKDYSSITGDTVGLAMIAPFSVLEKFYSFSPAGARGMPTLEWFTMPFCLEPLSKGKEDAVNHPELSNPLQNYIYRFTMYLQVFQAKTYDYASFRPIPQVSKQNRYKLPNIKSELFTNFKSTAKIWNPNPIRPIRILALINASATAEIAELNRRLNTQMTLVEVDHPHVFKKTQYYGWEIPEPGPLLEKELKKKPQVILLSGTYERALPKVLVKQLIEQVKSGSSIIYISDSNQFPSLITNRKGKDLPTWVTMGIPLNKLPVRAKSEEFKLGNGKVIWIKFRLNKSGLPWTQEGQAVIPYLTMPQKADFPYWEYYFSYYGKLFSYAAGEIPTARINSALIEKKLTIEIQSRKSIEKAELLVEIDGPTKQKLHQIKWKGKLRKGRNKIELSYPIDKLYQNGDYYFNIRLFNKLGSLDWFTTIKQQQLENFLEKIKTKKYAHHYGEPVQIISKVSGQGVIQLRLRDAAGRVLALKTKSITQAGKYNFKLYPKTSPWTPLVKLEARLLVDNHVVDQKEQTLTIEPTKTRKLNFLIWNYGFNNWKFREFDQALGEIGFTVATFTGINFKNKLDMRQEAESAMAAGMRYAPFQMHEIRASKAKLKFLQRTPCLRNPKYLETIRHDVRKNVQKAQENFPFAYFSGDENSLGAYDLGHNFCQSVYCMLAFRNAMRHKYKKLSNLNNIWQTTFKSWDELKPDTFQEAQYRKCYVSWFEHRNFMMHNVSNCLKIMKKELQQYVPGAKLGISGQTITGLHSAFNWLEALQVVNYPLAYIRLTDGLRDLIRSNKLPSGSGGAWIGYGSIPEVTRYKYWDQIINGLFTPSFWWYATFFRHGDAQLTNDGIAMKKLLTEINESGVDKIFVEAKYKRSPVTLVYSIPSLVMAQITGTHSRLNYNSFIKNYHGWSGLLRDLGFQPPMVIGPEKLEEISPQSHPILILPMTQVLNTAQCMALKRYVKAGGKLIADAQPGSYNKYGSKRSKNPLNKLFGIIITPVKSGAVSGFLKLKKQSLKLMLFGGKPILQKGVAYGEISLGSRSVKFGGIKIRGGSNKVGEAAIINQYGQGRTLYLNFLLNEYSEFRRRQTDAEPVIQSFRYLFKKLDIPIAEHHKLSPGINVVEYQANGNRYLGISRIDNDASGDVRLKFDKKYQIYDVLKHCRLDMQKYLKLTLEKNGVRILAVLPRPVGELCGNIERDGRLFKLPLKLKTPTASSVVRLNVSLNGKYLRNYSANYVINDELTIEIDPGLEPASGEWRFDVRELFSGQTFSQTFNLKPRKR